MLLILYSLFCFTSNIYLTLISLSMNYSLLSIITFLFMLTLSHSLIVDWSTSSPPSKLIAGEIHYSRIPV